MRRHPATRLLSTTLAMLMVLYSLPPNVERTDRFPEANNPAPDQGMLFRHFLNQFDLARPLSEFEHRLSHARSSLMIAMGQLSGLARLTPTADAHHYDHVVTSKTQSHFQWNGQGTTFFEPPDVPARDSDGKFEYKTGNIWPLPDKDKKKAPDQRSQHSLTLPVLDKDDKNPRSVEFHNSYFTEHGNDPGNLGHNIFAARFFDDSNRSEYSRMLIQNRADRSIILEQTGRSHNPLDPLNWGFLKNEWQDWRLENTRPGSGYGAYKAPKYKYGGVRLVLKENPWWAYREEYNSDGKFDRLIQGQYDLIVSKRYSLYYWETNEIWVNALKKNINRPS